mgnify:FL=1
MAVCALGDGGCSLQRCSFAVAVGESSVRRREEANRPAQPRENTPVLALRKISLSISRCAGPYSSLSTVQACICSALVLFSCFLRPVFAREHVLELIDQAARLLRGSSRARPPAPASAPPLRFPLPGKAVLFPTLPAPNQFTPQRPAAPSKSGVRKNHPTGCRNQLCAFLWREMSLSLRTQFWQGICGCSEVQAPSYQPPGKVPSQLADLPA